MLQPDPIRAAARAATRAERFDGAACSTCGATDPRVLHARQGHHVANRVNESDLTVVQCLNCHAIHTEANAAAGIPNRYPDEPTPFDRLAAVLAGIGVFLASVAQLLIEWAHWIDETQRNLIARGIKLADIVPAWIPSLAGAGR